MKRRMLVSSCLLAAGVWLAPTARPAHSAEGEPGQKPSSYMPVVITEDFASIMARMKAAKPGIEQKHAALLAERYDLSDRPAKGVTMSRGKPVQEGVRVKLPSG